MPFLNRNIQMKGYRTPHSLGTAARVYVPWLIWLLFLLIYSFGLTLLHFLDFLIIVFRAEGPPTSIILLMP
jgi:hypothetical protein